MKAALDQLRSGKLTKAQARKLAEWLDGRRESALAHDVVASFRVALGPDEGMVVATYLRSYENMGKAKLYVGDENAVVDPRGGPRWRGRG